MKKVYLSPSSQKENAYAYGNTTEDIQCGKIAKACKVALERSGVSVKLGQYDTMANRCAASDAFGADLHVPIHTNACNGKVTGTRIFCYDMSGVTAICIDETSFKKGQSYVTIVSDAKARKVIDVEKGRDREAVVSFSYKLEEKGGDCNKITQYISDMSPAYMKAKEECFPRAKQIIDKFHVKQMMLKAMDEVRREEQGRTQSRKRTAGKKLLMIPEARQSEEQKRAIDTLAKKYPKTGRAYRMVQQIDDMYRCNNIEEAEDVFNKMVRWMKRSRLEPMKKVADTLKNNKTDILNYFYHRVTNAIAEGINSLIQSAKRRARGFRTYEGYECMIYLVVGKLSLSCPSLFA